MTIYIVCIHERFGGDYIQAIFSKSELAWNYVATLTDSLTATVNSSLIDEIQVKSFTLDEKVSKDVV